jgi:Amt family ammonium transporter
VVGVHLVGGMWGTLSVGFLASKSAPAGVNGLFYGGGVDQLWRQAVGAVAVLLYSFILTLIIGYALHKTIGFRVKEEAEMEGVDSTEHAETAYDLGALGGTLRGVSLSTGPARHAADNNHDEEVSA